MIADLELLASSLPLEAVSGEVTAPLQVNHCHAG
jgi:hypothetical protein